MADAPLTTGQAQASARAAAVLSGGETSVARPRRTSTSTAFRRRDATLLGLLAGADAATVLLAVAVVSWLEGTRPRPLVVVLAPLALMAAKVAGLYDRDDLMLRKSTLEDVPGAFQIATLLALVVRVLDSALLQGEPGGGGLLSLWGGLFLALIVGRIGARAVASRLTPPERCLVVGPEDIAAGIQRKLGEAVGVRADVVRVVTLDGPARSTTELASCAEAVRHALAQGDVDRVFVASATLEPQLTLEIVRLTRALGVKLSVAPPLPELVGRSVMYDELHGAPLLGVRRLGLSGPQRWLKRSFDLVAGALGLVLALPVLAVAAVALKRDSPGALLFRQTRVGRNGVPFDMLKLRTMADDAHERRAELAALNQSDGLFKIVDDPRVTRIGRLLRHTSLDELPQLWNVLRGEMSLVGPRPLVLEEDRRIEGWERRRLDVRPGITGPWQLLGATRVSLQEMAQIDYVYLASWSLWLDVKILLRTVAHVVRGRGL